MNKAIIIKKSFLFPVQNLLMHFITDRTNTLMTLFTYRLTLYSRKYRFVESCIDFNYVLTKKPFQKALIYCLLSSDYVGIELSFIT